MSSFDPNATPVLELIGITKRYRGVTAIDNVNFMLRPGEVHALVGENGAGKSTLCKIVAGTIEHDAGEMFLSGQAHRFRSPIEALHQGVGMVYQETSLVPTMTVAQNIELGHEKVFTRYRSLNIGAQNRLQSLNFQVDPAAIVSTLGTAKRQMVEIVRALRSDVRLIIFDEPTASLSPEEIWYLFNIIRSLKSRGIGIIFVSHALEEALSIADNVTVLRDGKLQITAPAASLTKADLIRHMIGRPVSTEFAAEQRGDGQLKEAKKKVLRVENVTMGTIVKNMSFTANQGEVLGIFGLIGAGRTESMKVIAGIMKRNRIQGGMIYLNDRPVRYRVPMQAVRDGIAYVTEDRKLDGFFETMSIAENIYLGKLAFQRNKFFTSRAEMKRIGTTWIKRLSIRAINGEGKLIELSGGNQQKVTVGKSLVQDPQVVIFDEPTRGVDVGAIAEIHAEIRRLAKEGKTVIVVSSYLPEIQAISDRILVARDGRIAAEFLPQKATDDEIMFAAIY